MQMPCLRIDQAVRKKDRNMKIFAVLSGCSPFLPRSHLPWKVPNVYFYSAKPQKP